MFLKNYAYLIVLILFASSCAPSPYLAITSLSVPSELESKSKKTILISSRYFSNADRLVWLLNSKKTVELQSEINGLQDLQAQRFIRGIESMISGDHEKAFFDLAVIPKSGFDYQVQILMADVLHSRQTANVNLPGIYQEVVDSTKNEIIRSIAIKRFRFLKYETAAQ